MQEEITELGSSSAQNALLLPFYRLKIAIRFTQRSELPQFAGSTLHGGFGHALMAADENTFASVFDPTDTAGTKLIKPYLFEVSPLIKRQFEPGDTWQFGLTLLGNATASLPQIVAALLIWQELGLGSARAKFNIETISLIGIQSRGIYAYKRQYQVPLPSTLEDQLLHAQQRAGNEPADCVWIECTSPWHVKEKGVAIEHAPAACKLMNLIHGRINTLAQLHSSVSMPLAEPVLDRETKLIKEFTTFDKLPRFSKSNARKIHFPTLNGQWCYQGDMANFIPWLALGEIVGVGNKTTFGFGQFKWSLACSES
ncbi:CRISPR system precrRNA processing endoribonuclease RAMP protein Cas6 [Alteromonas ponticola]|uniref:CRISPR system precrRNA processing endoribonuclease RAMP protein Cas6 n=1 Tax=Alteromonas aquimaris TaxID=2998417 RepID=A0ABT3P9Z0_9ALTE|nr:CRISPR system precrRNA processing endoribonuclease RAMP protein Cas6 [Alteromonas aquimaris]MCW8109602.1 CRISPR system precrRNA processing endoribonuclease RAMP protein Cas6 [Alteromonas aquimaris]